jgi:hypothetical protein
MSANRESTFATLATTVDKVVRNSDSKLDIFMKQVEERIKSEFLPDLIAKILRAQEDNVYNRLSPRLDPLMRFIEELYQLIPSVKSRTVQLQPNQA